jgi:hypothetical protein
MSLQLRKRFWGPVQQEITAEIEKKILYNITQSPLSAAKKRRVEELFAILTSPVIDVDIKLAHLDATIIEFADQMEPKDDPLALEFIDWWEYRYRVLWRPYLRAMRSMEDEFRTTGNGRLLVPLQRARDEFEDLTEGRMISKGIVVLVGCFGKQEHVPLWEVLQPTMPTTNVTTQRSGAPV